MAPEADVQGPQARDKQADPDGSVPAAPLPDGGDAIRSIDEQFAVIGANAAGGLSVPMAGGPGCSGFAPRSPFVTTQAPATVRLAGVGTFLYRASLARLAKGCRAQFAFQVHQAPRPRVEMERSRLCCSELNIQSGIRYRRTRFRSPCAAWDTVTMGSSRTLCNLCASQRGV